MTDDLAAFLDQSCLRPESTPADVDAACDEALRFRFRGLVVPGAAVAQAKARLVGSGVKVVSVVAFPHGTQAVDVKAFETSRALAAGADEIDYVISIGAARTGDLVRLREEAVAVLRAAGGVCVKAILEVGHLPERQVVDTAAVLVDCGVHFVKTCTGFGPRGCTVDDVRLLVRAVGGRARVKASGGVQDRTQALALLEAGASVIGTSRGPKMCT
jgi:deoxyribose-phosphate aldolase